MKWYCILKAGASIEGISNNQLYEYRTSRDYDQMFTVWNGVKWIECNPNEFDMHLLNPNIMTNTELLNAIYSRIATLQFNTELVRGQSYNREEITTCIIKEIAYQECRNIVLSVLGEVEGC